MRPMMKQLFIDSTINMADKKISELTQLTDTGIATADEFAVYDADTGTTKSITKENLDKSTGEVVDTVFTVIDNVDNTKKAQFDTSTVTAGNTRILSVPDSNTTLLGTDASQSVTNKTIDPSQNTIDGDVLHIDYDPTNYTPTITPDEVDDVDDLTAHLAGIDNALSGTSTREYTYYPSDVDPTLQIGSFNYASLGSSASTHFVFKIPDDVATIAAAAVVCIPDATETIAWDLTINGALAGEVYDTNSATVNNDTQAVTTSEIEELSITAGISTAGVTAGDYVGVQFSSNTDTLRVIGLYVKYNIN